MVAMITFCFLIACTDNEQNSIEPSQLTNREQLIINALSDNVSVFDYQLTEDYQEIELWVDRYENGELVEERMNVLSSHIENREGSILFSMSELAYTPTGAMAMIDEGSSGSVTFELTGEGEREDYLISQNTFPQETWNEQAVFAVLAYVDQEGAVSGINQSFFTEPDQHIGVLQGYQEAYVFRGKLIK